MKILIVSATELEIQPFMDWIEKPSEYIDVLIAGVGMVATSYALSKKLQSDCYDAVINVGIAGTFNKSFKLGSVLRIVEDRFSELGAEDDDVFRTLEDLGLGDSVFNENPKGLESLSSLSNLQKTNGITVNKVHGKKSSILNTQQLFSPALESMEGAAVFYVCERENTSCIQIRAVSNQVEKRNKMNWNIPLAIQSMNSWLVDFVEECVKKIHKHET